ncbi:hypothetical protein LINPERHAP1_LOCUS36738 [Linum perenne]
MKERLDYLERCVVFIIVGGGKVRWNEFRVWAARNWGVPSASEVYPVGDDLWLLECASSAEVSRIVALNRRVFGESEIMLGPWMKMARRSRVAWDSNVVWVTVRGIPLHLRSLALAESVGEVCGDFLDTAGGSDLSSLRVKVRIRDGLPKVIPISAGGEVFPVSVVPEVSFPLVSAGPKEVDMTRQKGKGIRIEGDCLSALGSSEMLVGECSMSKEIDSGEIFRFRRSVEPEVSPLVMETGQSDFSCQQRGHQRFEVAVEGGPKRMSELAVSSEKKGLIFLGKEAAPFLGLRLSTDGLRVGNFKLALDKWAVDKWNVDKPL